MGRIIKPLPAKLITSTSFDGAHSLVFNEDTHRYTLDGARVPGATTIGGVYPKGEGLIRWMIEQGVKEYDEKNALTKGGSVGTFLHKYAELYEENRAGEAVELGPYTDDIKRVIEHFHRWRRGNNDEIVMSEDLCASPKLKVGGRIDTLRNRAGMGLVLSDYKTTKAIYVTHLIQVIGGYRRMLREWHDLDVPYVEIVKFPKQPDVPFESLLCDAHGWVRTVGDKVGERVIVPALFKRIEDQFERNLGTYTFQKEVDEILMPPFKRAK